MTDPARRLNGAKQCLGSADHESETGLLSRIQAGDQEAFAALFNSFHGPLCAFVYRYLAVRELAEEIVQDVFLYIWDRRETWLPSSIKAYLFTAARNGALSYLRHQHVVEQRGADSIQLFSGSVPSVEDQLDASELVRAVQSAVNRLPTRCRLIFTLHREQGLKYSEIAEVLKLSPKTVEVQMGRALKSLRKSLADFWP